MTTEKSDLFRKLLNIDKRILYIIIIVLLGYPLIKPFGLPIKIDPESMVYYDTIENLQPGSIVLATIDIIAGQWGEAGPQGISTLQHLFDKEGVKFIQVIFFNAENYAVFETMILPAVDQGDKIYGVDWVNMGFLQGHETGMASFASDFMSPVKDAYGNLLSDLPLMKEVNSAKDVDLYIDLVAADYLEAFRQFSVAYNLPTLHGTVSMGIPAVLPFLESGVVDGLLMGLKGAAQYEYLLKKPGMAIKGMDSISLSHIFLVVLIIFTNIIYLIDRWGGNN